MKPIVRGLLLRSVLVHVLSSSTGPFSVGDLHRGVERLGFTVAGRPSQTISNALRAEVNRGRARRVGRGLYRIGHMPPTTAWRIRDRVTRARRGDAPPHLLMASEPPPRVT